jgi:hypothetical protein
MEGAEIAPIMILQLGEDTSVNQNIRQYEKIVPRKNINCGIVPSNPLIFGGDVSDI